MEKITIIIADDNLQYGKNLFNLFEKFDEDINIIGLATTGEETIEMVNRLKPDFLILDLKMPNKNGIEVLEELSKSKNFNTNIILISGERELMNIVPLSKYKNISNMITKPFDFNTLHKIIRDNNSMQEIHNYGECIDDILHEFNFNFSSQSYIYLSKCIEKAINRPLILKEIYQEVAKEEQINANKVKWGIQKLITAMVRYTPLEVLKKYIPYSSNISPKTYIYAISKRVEYINNK